MKFFRTIMIVFLLSSMMYSFIAIPVESQSSEILTPDFIISGTFNPSHTSDYYGMEISSPGVYLITVNSTGGIPVTAIASRYSHGSASSIASCYSNSSNSFRIVPSSMYLGAIYQLSVKTAGQISEQVVSYQVSVEHIEPLTLVPNTQYSLSIDSHCEHHYILDVNNGPKIYLFSATTAYYSPTFIFYNSFGILIASFSSYEYSQGILLLDSGTYQLFIYSYYSSLSDVLFELIDVEAPILEPGYSTEINFTGPSYFSQYAILSIQEGMQYSMYFDPENNEDVAFSIFYYEYSGPSFNDWGPGETESVNDLTFWQDSIAYTDWDMSPNMTITRSRPVISYSYNPTTIYPLSKLIIAFSSDTAGKAVFDYTEVGFAQTIYPNVQITEHFDGIDGPFWKLYKVSGLLPSNLYTFNLIHDAAPDCVLYPSYRLYQPTKIDQGYLFTQRPLLTTEERNYRDLLPDGYTTLSYDSMLSNVEIPYYQSQSGDRWLLVSIPDRYYNGGFTSNPLHSGDIHVGITKIEPIEQQVDSSFSFNPATASAAIYTLQLKGNSLYQIEMSSSSLQSQGSITLWNRTGHQLAITENYVHYSKHTSRFYFLEVENIGEHYLVVQASGDGPLTITVRSFSNNNTGSGIQTLFFVGGIAAAAAEGLLIGVVIGKIKFGKQPQG